MSRSELAPEPSTPGGSTALPALPAPPALRASHEDRDRVVEQLRVAAGDGRLTAEELDERLETALTARTCAELAPLLSDLPSSGSATGTGPAPVGDVPELTRLRAHRSNLERRGAWIVPRRLELDARSANVEIDFTSAVVGHQVLDLDLTVKSCNVRLVVPPGMVVTVDDLAVESSSVQQRVRHPADTAATLLVRVSGSARSSNVEVRNPRVGFLERRRARRALRAATREAVGAAAREAVREGLRDGIREGLGHRPGVSG
jgi:hypothetical protein